MEKFSLRPTEDLPGVTVDPDQGLIEFWGQSLPEDSVVFFKPIIEAIEKYIANPKPKTTVNLKLIYLNTSSSKKMIEIAGLLEGIYNNGLTVEVNWICKSEDEDMVDEGREFARLIAIPVNIITE